MDAPLAFANRLWAIEPRWFASFLDALNQPLMAAAPERMEAARAAARTRAGDPGGVAVIPVHGPITMRPDPILAAFGFETLSSLGLQAAIRAAVASPDVRGLVFDIDSPGGEVAGMTELARLVRSLRGSKPMVGVANPMAASAAYWFGSQLDELYVTPSGEVGAIGIIGIRADLTAAAERSGVRAHIITAGKYKGEGHPLREASDDELAAMQAQADAHYQVFTSDVARGRRVPVASVREGFGEGRMVLAHDAVAVGMADREGTLDDAIAAVHRGQVEARRVAASEEGGEWAAEEQHHQVDPDVCRRLWEIARA